VSAWLLALLLGPAPPAFSYAPVYLRTDDAVLERIGALRYTPQKGFDILFCIAPKRDAVFLDCVVTTPDDHIVLIPFKASGMGL
jgi:hypothetical protein